MKPLSGAVSIADAVPVAATLDEVAPRVLAADGPVVVVDGDGRPVGLVTRGQLIGLLFQPLPAA